jgi:tetratricopeptide (TPR) repeat protein
MANPDLDRVLQEGIAAARGGQKERARELLLQVIGQDEEVEAAWLWLSGVVDDPEERRICLENVLALNPGNAAARNGLRWLAEQEAGRQVEWTSPSPIEQLEPPPQLPDPGSGEPAPPQPPAQIPPRPTTVQIDPYGCPYCGGSAGSGEPRCDHCGQLVEVRQHKRVEGTGPGWVALFFLLLGAATLLDGYLVSQLASVGQLPQWLGASAVRFLVGAALFAPEGVQGELADLAGTVIVIDTLLAGLCLVAAAGLALRSRLVYLGSFILAGLLAIATVIGLLTQLVGWLPALFRLGLVAISVKWLVDSAPAFEWETRRFNADVDQDLKNDLDYYNRGMRYRDERMWAKAAAHWEVAARLAPGQVQYHAALANAYLRMGYPAAALSRIDRALVLAPDDEKLHAFRDAVAELEEGS